MVWLDLIYNLSLLVALSVVSGFVDSRWKHDTLKGKILQGVVFGVATTIGMLHPFVFAPGLIFDGRSVMISLAALFFGPWTAAVACLMTIPVRIAQGGAGMLMGVSTILSSAGIGIGFHLSRKRPAADITAAELLGFGILVHVTVLALTMALPAGTALDVLRRIGVPIMVVYPLATVLVGKIMADHAASIHARTALHDSLSRLRDSEERLRQVVDNSPSIIYSVSGDGIIRFASPSWTPMLGHRPEEVVGTHYRSYLHPDDIPLCKAAVNDLVEGRSASTDVEYRVRHQNGDYCWHRSVITVDVDADRNPVMMFGNAVDVTKRRKAEEALRHERNLLHALMDNMPDRVYFKDSQSRFVRVNRAHAAALGLQHPDEAIGKTDADVHPSERAREYAREEEELVRTRRPISRISENKEPDGSRRWLSTTKAPITDKDGRVTGLVGITRDVTHEMQLQEASQESHKMESIGRLAGGIAHDFNNLLMGIMGYAELSRDGLDADHPIREYLDAITSDAQRSAHLTRQLLAFARKQVIAPQALDLNDEIANLLNMVRRLIGEDIDLVCMPGSNPWLVKMDPGQLDQVLVNLCVNARDAIAGTGKITLQTRNAAIDQAFCQAHPEAMPGSYVMLAVSDDACGMTEEVLAHIFEPFFTTKEVGKGTGLGLATVFGIVKQNNGFILVDSTPGKGTTFRVYIPRLEGDPPRTKQCAAAAEPRGGSETILLVEDDSGVRTAATYFLERLGYAVLAAETPHAALAMVKQHDGEIDLLLTDVVMPGMNGRELARKLAKAYRNMQVLYMSGYTVDAITHRGVVDEDIEFLPKPFGRDMLSRRVREVLDGTSR